MKDILKGQIWHLSFLLLLLVLMFFLFKADSSVVNGGLFGVSTKIWLIISVCVPIAHQIYVMLLWRIELFGKLLSRTFGAKAFSYYKIGFAFLILLRPASILILAFSNSDTINICALARYLGSILLLVPGLYLAYSIKKYFGIDRAFGKDHFYPEEAKTWSMVNQGIFKYSSNSMYVFGFMALWVPGLLLQSKAALLVALFNHLYIWVHYYYTEKPDIGTIYKL